MYIGHGAPTKTQQIGWQQWSERRNEDEVVVRREVACLL
jgi:hypothetical protein